MENLYGLIMAGGSGTRLWPISRKDYPKQFLQLTGNKTLIQQTFLRLKKIIPSEKIYITTNKTFAVELFNQLRELGLHKKNIILQPSDKNTGPAITQATKIIFKKDKEAVIVTCPSDHLIKPQSAFTSYLRAAYKLGQKDLLVTFGILPTKANPEYGYIIPNKKSGQKVNSHVAFAVQKFTEKPNTKKAVVLIKKGSLWNSGIFVWKAKVILEELEKLDKASFLGVDSKKKYLNLRPVAIDKSVLEKSNLVWVIPVDFKWKDIGSWKALYEVLPKNNEENVIENKAKTLGTKKSLVFGVKGKTLVAIDLENFIVVDTGDALLISPTKSVHKVKEIVKKMIK